MAGVDVRGDGVRAILRRGQLELTDAVELTGHGVDGVDVLQRRHLLDGVRYGAPSRPTWTYASVVRP